MKIIEYYSNNSGGIDWLKEREWKSLEDNGWKLFGFDDFIYKYGKREIDEDGLPKRIEINDKDRRVKYAFKKFESIEKAIEEFENLTNQNADDEGCSCCGKPHNFSEL